MGRRMEARNAKLKAKYALRAIEGQDNRFGGYFPAFTGPEELDSFGQYFTRETNLGLDLFPTMDRPLDWRHNLHDVVGGVGRVVHMELRDDGLWVESELDPVHGSYPFLRDEIAKGAVGYSGETLPNWMKWTADGHVTDFPIFAMAISPFPSAPNGKTTVGFMREAGLEDLVGDDADEMTTTVRGIWDFPPAVEPPAPVQQPSPPARPRTLSYSASGATPTRTLNGQHLRGDMRRPGQPPTDDSPGGLNITEMTSEVDRVELGVGLAWYRTAKKRSHLRGETFRPPEHFLAGMGQRFMKAVVEDSKKDVADQNYINRSIAGHNDVGTEIRSPSSVSLFLRSFPEELRDKVGNSPAYLRANELMRYDYAGFGDEWVYDAWRTQVWHDIRSESVVFSLFPSFVMPSNPYNVPVISNPGYARRVPDTANQSQLTYAATPYPAEQYTTSNKTFEILDKVGKILFWQDEYEKWSQVDLFAEQYRFAFEMMWRTLDRIILNGDETDTNSNISWYQPSTGTTPSAEGTPDFLLVADGLRHHAKVTATSQSFDVGAAFSFAGFLAWRKKLGVLGHMVDRLVSINSSDLAYDFIGTTEVKTKEVFGEMATVKEGEIGRYQGVSLVMTEELKTEYDGDGFIPQAGGGTDYGGVLAHRDGVLIGVGWDIEISDAEIWYADAKALKMRASMDLQVMQSNAVSFAYDWTA